MAVRSPINAGLNNLSLERSMHFPRPISTFAFTAIIFSASPIAQAAQLTV